MLNGFPTVPSPHNEAVKNYAPGSGERQRIKQRLDEMLREEVEVPAVIGGKEVRTGRLGKLACPHQHDASLGTYHRMGEAEVEAAIAAAGDAWQEWSAMAWQDRASVFLRAAELLAGPWRDTVNAATMLGQSKTVYQAEIDSACELIDFWRWNVSFMKSIYEDQPTSSAGVWNYSDYRPLEGFVFAVSPFNFTSIAGNLPTAPAMMGNTVLWKPASTSVLSNYYLMKVLQEAGLPDGVVNFVPGSGGDVGTPATLSPELAGIHFTGSTPTFQHLWRTVGENVANYRGYPRVVGETGGKDFVFAHPSADVPSLVAALVRGSFEYQGQKCSASSRAYIPTSLWPAVRALLSEQVAELAMGSPLDFRNFLAAVIDEASFRTISTAIDEAKSEPDYEVVCGGGCDEEVGWFIEPTVVESRDPQSRLMQDEIFGPLLTIFVYPDQELEETLEVCNRTSPYALTGAVFANDRQAIAQVSQALRFAAGNFYINDKPTGAVVGQQPFGGARASGTNDKAGSMMNLLRWTSARAIKENLAPPTDYAYPHMEQP